MPTYYARVSYTGNGSNTSFAIPFSYIDSTHIQAFIDGVQTTAFTISTSTLTFTSAPANGAIVLIKRNTPKDTRIIDFTDGSVLTESDLDKSADQNFYVAQEVVDDGQSHLALDAQDRYDANSKRIINVADPTSDQDVATKYYLENTWLTTANKTALTTVNANIGNINAVNSNETNINTVASQITPTNNISTLAGLNTEISNLGNLTTEITNLNSIRADITAVNNISADIQAVENKLVEIQAVASDLAEVQSEIDTVANSIANVDAVGTNIQGVNTIGTVASNLTSVNYFGNNYKISATEPTSPTEGMLWWDSTNDTMKVYSGSSFQNAGSSVNGTSQRSTFTATASQTVFTGSDDYGVVLTFDNNYLDVFLNGVKLVEGASNDYTVSGGTTITLTSGAGAGDILQTISYGTFDIASFSATAITSDTLGVARGGTGLTTSDLTGNAGKAILVNSSANGFELQNASSAEVYGFHKDSNGDLIVTTTNQGVDSISQSTYANFEEVLFSASGFSFSISNGELIATI